MKRDMDLIRHILLETEKADAGAVLMETDVQPPETRLTVLARHISLLAQAGLLHAAVSDTVDDEHAPCVIQGITWQGYEFLDKIRNETIWNETKRTIGSRGLGFAVELVTAVATSLAKQQMGLPP